MHHCSVIGESLKRLEAVSDVSLLLSSELSELVYAGKLGDVHLVVVGLNPVHEFCYSNSVLDVSLSDVSLLNRVLHRLHENCWVSALNLSASKALI